MYQVDIKTEDDKHFFNTGDRIVGSVKVMMPAEVPISNVSISFRCEAEVKWVENLLDQTVYHERELYHNEPLVFNEADIKASIHLQHKDATIPFAFDLPKDKHLPSSMETVHGSIKYYILVSIQPADPSEKCKEFTQKLIVYGQSQNNLKVGVAGVAEKHVLLHSGNVTMHASIERKGWVQGETIPVHVAVDNKTGVAVTPRVSLHQVQVYMSGRRHKSVDTQVSGKVQVAGTEVPPLSQTHQHVSLEVPCGDALSLKSSLISVKYFVRVVLDIPQSFDLRVDLPVVLTRKDFLDL